jgi:hypothetical protein
MGYLTITLGDLNVTMNKFVGNGHIRTRPRLAQISRTAHGTLVAPGQSFELPHFWQGVALLDATDILTFRAIWSRAEHAKRTAGTGYQLTLDDTTRPFEEVGTRTREIVSGESETSIGTPAVTSYHARFYGVFEEGEPEYNYLGMGKHSVAFRIWEDGIFAAS